MFRPIDPAKLKTLACITARMVSVPLAGMRRSEVSALRWADVADAADGDGIEGIFEKLKTLHPETLAEVG